MAKRANLEELTPEERAVVVARRAYKKAWREKNIERVRESERRFYERKAAELGADNKNAPHRVKKTSYAAKNEECAYELTVELQGAKQGNTAVYDNVRKTIANEVSQFLQDAGFEEASKAVDCEFDL